MTEPPMSEFVQVVTTSDSEEGAAKIARSSVEAHLAACAQVDGPIQSTYWWDGAVDASEEWRVTLKTSSDRCAELIEHVKGEHTYDVPEVLVTPVAAGNLDYLDWVRAETQPRD